MFELEDVIHRPVHLVTYDNGHVCVGSIVILFMALVLFVNKINLINQKSCTQKPSIVAEYIHIHITHELAW